MYHSDLVRTLMLALNRVNAVPRVELRIGGLRRSDIRHVRDSVWLEGVVKQFELVKVSVSVELSCYSRLISGGSNGRQMSVKCCDHNYYSKENRQ